MHLKAYLIDTSVDLRISLQQMVLHVCIYLQTFTVTHICPTGPLYSILLAKVTRIQRFLL